MSKENRTFKKEICGKASKEASSSFEVKHFNTLSYYYVQRFFARTLVMTYSIEVIISQPMSLQFSHYRMIKMATKNSFYHLFYLLCAIQLPFQQRVLHLRSCMRGTHCDSKVLNSAISRQAKVNKFSLVFWLNEIVPLRRNRYNSYTIYLDVNRASRLGLLLCLTDETKDLH